MAATTRKKAPARWAVLLVSGLASAGFLWGIVNTPGAADATDPNAAVPTPTPAVQQVSRQRLGRGDDDGITSVLVPSSQSPSSVQASQPAQTTQPLARTGRLRTRGS